MRPECGVDRRPIGLELAERIRRGCAVAIRKGMTECLRITREARDGPEHRTRRAPTILRVERFEHREGAVAQLRGYRARIGRAPIRSEQAGERRAQNHRR